MLTRMTEVDWAIVLEVFDAAQSRRGEPGHDDRKFLEVLHYVTVHNLNWRAIPAEYGKWNSIWKRFWRLSRSGVFEAFFQLLAERSDTAHLVQMLDSTVVRAHVSAAGAKGAARTSARAFARRVHLQARSSRTAAPPAFSLAAFSLASFPANSTRPEHASSRRSARSNASSASHCDARRRPTATQPSWRSRALSSWSNPSTRPSVALTLTMSEHDWNREARLSSGAPTLSGRRELQQAIVGASLLLHGCAAIGSGKVGTLSDLEGRWSGIVRPTDARCGVEHRGLMRVGEDTFALDPFGSTTIIDGEVKGGSLNGALTRLGSGHRPLSINFDGRARVGADDQQTIEGVLSSGSCTWNVTFIRD